MKRLLLFLCVISIILIATPVLAINSDAGTAGAPFLRLDVGARQAALGGAGAAITSDAYAMHWNVAALTTSRFHRIAFQHNEYFQDMNHEYLAYAGPISSNSSWGLSLNYFNAGDMDRTYETSGGAFGGYGGTFDASDIAVSAAYARQMTEEISLGVGVKYIHSSIEDESASGFGVDLGAYYAPASIDGLTLGLTVSNIGQGLKFIRERDDLPLTIRAGAGYEFWNDRLLLTLDLNKPRDNDLRVNTGVEWRVVQAVALRVGYNSQNDDVGEGLTAGAGFAYQSFNLDYAYVPFGDLGNSHRISASYAFGGGE